MKFSKKILILICLAIPYTANAQALNERWLGTWKSGKTNLVITQTSFEKCRWVGAKPKSTFKGCVSYYDGSVNKKDLIKYIQNDTENINFVRVLPSLRP